MKPDIQVGDRVIYRPVTGGQFRGTVEKKTGLKIGVQIDGATPRYVLTTPNRLERLPPEDARGPRVAEPSGQEKKMKIKTCKEAAAVADDYVGNEKRWRIGAQLHAQYGTDGAETNVWILAEDLAGFFGVEHWECGPLDLVTRSLGRAEALAESLHSQREAEYEAQFEQEEEI